MTLKGTTWLTKEAVDLIVGSVVVTVLAATSAAALWLFVVGLP